MIPNQRIFLDEVDAVHAVREDVAEIETVLSLLRGHFIEQDTQQMIRGHGPDIIHTHGFVLNVWLDGRMIYHAYATRNELNHTVLIVTRASTEALQEAVQKILARAMG
ncbi:hypothetical protein EBT31_03945 [bacterium]|nr:hypothetical protein [bacterium]